MAVPGEPVCPHVGDKVLLSLIFGLFLAVLVSLLVLGSFDNILIILVKLELIGLLMLKSRRL